MRAGVDSPMETRLRLLIVLAGLPEPEVDHRAHDDDGTLLRRYDLSYLPFRLIIEYDGRQHAESDEQWLSDIGRDEALDDERIRRLVVVARDIYSTPANTLARIPRALRRAGVPVPRTGTSGADTSRAGRATSRSRPDPTWRPVRHGCETRPQQCGRTLGGYDTAYARITTRLTASVRSRRTAAEPEPITLRMGNRRDTTGVGRGVLVHSGHG